MYGEWRKRLRLQWFDYSSRWYYFMTICTKGGLNHFGDIVDGKQKLNDYGNIAKYCWENIIQHYPWIELDEYVIMPNHIHWIIIVGNEYFRSNEMNDNPSLNELPVGNEYFRSDRKNSIPCPDNSHPNISNVIKWFKIWVTKEIRQDYGDYEFGWQKSFYDVIIRNDEQLQKTREYIVLNPMKWWEDKNNPDNL